MYLNDRYQDGSKGHMAWKIEMRIEGFSRQEVNTQTFSHKQLENTVLNTFIGGSKEIRS